MAQTADTLVLFGATGDLTQRMLLPSLFGLHIDHLLPRKLAILGTSRSDMGTTAFARWLKRRSRNICRPIAICPERARIS
jgi:glucose-6-phosphate 1-dehydrogenase